jgi:hypothetical protein
LAAAWPGGKANRSAGHDAWIYCFSEYKAFARRIEIKEAMAVSTREELAHAVQRAASRGAISVELSVGTKHVYPKSLWALCWLESLNAIVRPVEAVANELLQTPGAESLRGLPPFAQGLAWRTWLWILTTPGVGVPFDDEDLITPPDWTASVVEEDFLLVYSAHRAIHRDDLALIANAFPPSGQERTRLDLGGFIANHAHDIGVAPSDIMRKWSLPETFASAVASAEAHRVAKVNAKAARQE